MKKLICWCKRVIEIETTFVLERPDGGKAVINHAHSMSQGSEIQCVCGRML